MSKGVQFVQELTVGLFQLLGKLNRLFRKSAGVMSFSPRRCAGMESNPMRAEVTRSAV
jgi:hypothetical protein